MWENMELTSLIFGEYFFLMQLYMTFVLKVKWPLYFLLLFQSGLLRVKMVHTPVGMQLSMEPSEVSARKAVSAA